MIRLSPTLTALLLLASGCSAAPKSSEAPDFALSTSGDTSIIIDSFDDVVYESPLSEEPQLTVDGPGDMNQRPIHVWFIGDEHKRRRVYTVGHADGECCHLVSGALSEAARQPFIHDHSWFSYGVGDFQAGSHPDAQDTLSQLEGTLKEFEQRDVCRGQLFVHGHTDDPIDFASDEITEIAQAASKVAQQEQRPIMVWYELPPGIPAFVPAYSQHSGSDVAKPVQFDVSRSDLDYPQSVVDNVSLDGIGQYIASLRAGIEQFRALLEIAKILDAIGDKTYHYNTIDHRRYTTNYRSPNLGSQIRTANTRLRAIREFWNKHGAQALRIVEIAQQHGFDETMALQPAIAEAQSDIATMLRENEAALAAWQALPVTPSPTETQIDVYELRGPMKIPGLPAELRDTRDIQREVAAMRKALRQAQDLRSSPPPDSYPALIDASIRGWPATFASERAEQAYDRWAQSHQAKVHQYISQQLSANGNRFEFDDLMSYRVAFRADPTSATQYRVTPTYVLSEGFYIVADPTTGLVRYESPNTDENLPAVP